MRNPREALAEARSALVGLAMSLRFVSAALDAFANTAEQIARELLEDRS